MVLVVRIIEGSSNLRKSLAAKLDRPEGYQHFRFSPLDFVERTDVQQKPGQKDRGKPVKNVIEVSRLETCHAASRDNYNDRTDMSITF